MSPQIVERTNNLCFKITLCVDSACDTVDQWICYFAFCKGNASAGSKRPAFYIPVSIVIVMSVN